MSYDLSISKGDLKIGEDGDLAEVKENVKLAQDVLKAVHTPKGSDPFYPNKGSDLTVDDIGKLANPDIIETKTEQSIVESLQSIQNIQSYQESIGQKVTEGEKLKSVDEVNVERDESDITQYNIQVAVTPEKSTGISPSDQMFFSETISTKE